MHVGVFTLRDLTIPSGSLVRIVGLTRYLRPLGCEVTLFAPTMAAELEGAVRFVPLRGDAARHSLSLLYAAAPTLLAGLRLLRHDAALVRVLNDAKLDLLHCHQHDAGFRLLKVRARLRCPVLFELHGILRMQQEDVLVHRRFPFHVPLLLRAERHLFARSDAIIARTDAERQHLRSTFSLGADKIHVVPDGADVDSLGSPISAGRQDAIRRRLGLNGKRVILFGGWFKLQSGVLDLVQAYSRLRAGRSDVALVLVGDGVLMPEVRRYLSAHGVTDVVLPGLMPRPEFRDLQQVADVVVTPESRTPFNELGAPLKLFECLASGRPTVATNIACHSAIVVDGDNGYLVEPDDPKRLAQGLTRALDAPDAAEVGARGRRTVVNHHSWRQSARTLVEAYAQVQERFRAVDPDR